MYDASEEIFFLKNDEILFFNINVEVNMDKLKILIMISSTQLLFHFDKVS